MPVPEDFRLYHSATVGRDDDEKLSSSSSLTTTSSSFLLFSPTMELPSAATSDVTGINKFKLKEQEKQIKESKYHMDKVVEPRNGFSMGVEPSSSEVSPEGKTNGIRYWEETIGMFLFKLTTARTIVSIVLVAQYILLLLGGFLKGTPMFIVMILTCIIGAFSNSKYVKLSLKMQSQDSVAHFEERNRVLISLAIFSVRYFVFTEYRSLLVPLYLLVVMSSNALSTNSWFYSLTPIYFTLAHFGGSAVYQILSNGLSLEFFESASLFLSILVFSNYVISATIHLRTKLTKLEQTTAQLENALSAKSVFLRHISHEFRSPCLSSLGSVELLRETNLTDYQRDLVETIASSDGILLNLIEDVLTLVKIEHEDRMEEEEGINEKAKFLTVFSLENCVKMIGNIIKSYSTQFEVNVRVSIDDLAKNVYVRANQTRVHQIISNLMTNSVKASKKGDSVELICCLDGEKSIVKGVTEQNVVFKVVDHGIGIPKEKQERIFEPFSQLHNLNESVYPGTGLGLNTVRHNVTAMRGTITLASELNQGTEFTVTLPLEVVQFRDCQEIPTEPSDIDPSIKRQLQIQENYIKLFSTFDSSGDGREDARIIVADDNAINRKVILKLIESLGYKADAVSNGQQLVDKFNPSQHKLIITDWNMPVMDGLEASKEIRKRHGNVKIFALTGDVTAETPGSVFDKVLIKPIHKGTLKKCIEEGLTVP